MLATASPAAAWCGAVGKYYNYSGQLSVPHNYEGVARMISTSSDRLSNYNNQHVAFYSGAVDYYHSGSQCGGQPYCWLQAGWAEGAIGTQVLTGHTMYFEIAQVYGYNLWPIYSFYPEPFNEFFTYYWTHTYDSNGYPIWAVYTDPGTGPVQIGTSDQWWCCEWIQSDAETYNGSTTNNFCPDISTDGSYQYFGTDGNGNAYSNDWLQNTFDTHSWTEWTGQVTLQQDYENHRIRNNSAFGTRGGS